MSSGHRRSPYGERGLKYWCADPAPDWAGRSPYGERGLKFRNRMQCDSLAGSLSLRRAWIEISTAYGAVRNFCVALLTESVD